MNSIAKNGAPLYTAKGIAPGNVLKAKDKPKKINGTKTTVPTTKQADLIVLNASDERAEAHNPTHKLNQKVFSKTSPWRIASPAVTPPARTGIISIGRNAANMQSPFKPEEPSFPSSTSMTRTRERKSRPSVPSRRSRLMASEVKRNATQLTPKPAHSIPLKTNVLISAVVPIVPINAGIQSKPRPRTTPARDQ